MKTIALLFLLATSAFTQVLTMNKAGHWNVLYTSPEAAQSSFYNIVVTGDGSGAATAQDVLYCDFDQSNEPFRMYCYATAADREGGDTTDALSGVIAITGTPGACLSSAYNCAVTLAAKNGSDLAVSLQFDKSQGIAEGVDFEVGPMNITQALVDTIVARALAGFTNGAGAINTGSLRGRSLTVYAAASIFTADSTGVRVTGLNGVVTASSGLLSASAFIGTGDFVRYSLLSDGTGRLNVKYVKLDTLETMGFTSAPEPSPPPTLTPMQVG